MKVDLRIHHVVDSLWHYLIGDEDRQRGYTPEHTHAMHHSLAALAASDEHVVNIIYGTTGTDPVCMSCPHYKGRCTKEPMPTEADGEAMTDAPGLKPGVYTIRELRIFFEELLKA